VRGLDYQTWPDRASTLPAGQSLLRASSKRLQAAGACSRQSTLTKTR